MERIGELTMEIKRKTLNCWICKDSGLVPYFKYVDKLEYEFAYKCSCICGQASSSMLIIVPNIVAENLALENYKRSEKIRSKNIPDLIIEAKKEWALLCK